MPPRPGRTPATAVLLCLWQPHALRVPGRRGTAGYRVRAGRARPERTRRCRLLKEMSRSVLISLCRKRSVTMRIGRALTRTRLLHRGTNERHERRACCAHARAFFKMAASGVAKRMRRRVPQRRSFEVTDAIDARQKETDTSCLSTVDQLQLASLARGRMHLRREPLTTIVSSRRV